MQLVDSHCHLTLIQEHLPLDEVLDGARASGVAHMLCVAIDMEGFAAIDALAERHACISASAGIHPNACAGADMDFERLRAQTRSAQVVAIGETGLDYFRSEGDLEWQRERFRQHISLARSCQKPLIIHMREARQDVISILQTQGADQVGGIMHCFVEDMETACQAMEMNFLISFSGIISFRNAGDLREVARALPLDRMLIETDSPYLAPVPFRGKTNQPAYVSRVAETIAELKDISVEAVAEQTAANFCELTGVELATPERLV